jgi:hypothetical protein
LFDQNSIIIQIQDLFLKDRAQLQAIVSRLNPAKFSRLSLSSIVM